MTTYATRMQLRAFAKDKDARTQMICWRLAGNLLRSEFSDNATIREMIEHDTAALAASRG